VSSLTSAGPLPPILGNLAQSPESNSVVLQVLSARAVGDATSPLVPTLLAASGPGNIVSGTVDSAQPDGTVTVLTRNGTFVTLHHPPELTLEPGNAVVLRVLTTAPVPQAAVLAVNGRPVVARPGSAAPGPANPQPGSTGNAILSGRPAVGPALTPPNAASIAASLMATISFEDETAIEAAISGDGLALGTGAAQDADSAATGPTLVATLVRPAPAKLGQPPLPVGTRYLVTVRDVGTAETSAPLNEPAEPEPSGAAPAEPPPKGTVSNSSDEIPAEVPIAIGTPTAAKPDQSAATYSTLLAAQEPAAPPPVATAPTLPDAGPPPSVTTAPPSPPVADAQPSTTTAGVATPPAQQTSSTPASATAAPQPAQIDDSAAFQAQSSVLAGRVASPRTDGETLVETAVGTLALPLPDPPPAGTAIQLKVSAVAPPILSEVRATGPSEASGATVPPTVVEAATSALAAAHAHLAAAIQTTLAFEPGTNLAAALFGFLAGQRQGNPSRSLDAPLRKALVEAGRGDLAARLDGAASLIGTTRTPQGPDGWTVTVLPFLGSLSTEPMRLYRKRIQDKDAEGKLRVGQRFVLELELARQGQMQFDGMVRERRFDLVVRSATPLEEDLQAQVRQIFRDGMLISGWAGEMGFGRTGRYPLLPIQAEQHPSLDLGA